MAESSNPKTKTGARPKAQNAHILMRLLASIYDIALLLSIELLAFIPITIAEQYLGTMPDWIKGMLAMTVAYAYFVGLWSKDGASTGMRPWHLRLAIVHSGDRPSFAAATVRFFALMITWLALFMTLYYMASRDTHHILFFIASLIPALSLLSMMMTPKRQALHDIVSNTAVFRIEKST